MYKATNGKMKHELKFKYHFLTATRTEQGRIVTQGPVGDFSRQFNLASLFDEDHLPLRRPSK
jgi:hypothetical protein